MAAHTVSDECVNKLRAQIDLATADPTTQIPGFVACVVNKDGKMIFSHASGKRGADINEPMTLDSVFWIASCTKMISGIVCMQLIEQGILAFDDADLVEKLCPELQEVKILKGYGEDGKPILVEKKNRITLRKLLTHTSGCGYTLFNHDLRRFGLPEGLDEFSALLRDITQPITFEPGTNWQYGLGVDWAGIMAERATESSFNDLMQKHIFTPLNIKDMAMFPSADMKSRLVYMHYRDPTTGKLSAREHMVHRPLVVDPESEEGKATHNSAGGGLFAKPSEYTKVIAMLLNNGTCPISKAQILKPETVEEMFRNQIPELPNFGRVEIPTARPELTNSVTDLYPQPPNQPQGWGVTFMLTIEKGMTGRAGILGIGLGYPTVSGGLIGRMALVG